MRRSVLAFTLSAVLLSLARVEAQDASANVEASWARQVMRVGAVACGPEEVRYFTVQAPSPIAVAEEPRVFLDLPGGGRAVIVTPSQEVTLRKVPTDDPIAITFGGWRVLQVVVYDHDDDKVFEARIARPEAGRLYLSIRPDWDEALCQKTLSVQAAIVRAGMGDPSACEWARRLTRVDDRIARRLLNDYGAYIRRGTPEAPTPPAAPAPPAPPAPPATPAPAEPPMAQPVEGHASESEVRGLLMRLEKAAFADDKLTVLRSFVESRRFLVAHVQRVVECFRFSDDRLRAVEAMNSRIVDRENFFQLYALFRFSDDKEKLRRIERGWNHRPDQRAR